MQSLLFVDVLGARQRWLKGGADGAKRLFDRFYRHVVSAARTEPPAAILDGAIESDSAALVCETASVGLRVARHLFVSVFESQGPREAPERMWLRGALVPFEQGQSLRIERGLAVPFQHVRLFTYAPDLFHAIAVEKSGFRGMRLLVRAPLITAQVRADFRIAFGARSWIPLRRLNHSGYPDGQGEDLQDFLWMVDESLDVWNQRRRVMNDRLRHAAKNAEELAQAAATQIVFHECTAILGSIRDRRRP